MRFITLLIVIVLSIASLQNAQDIHMPSAETLAQRLRLAGFDENFISESRIDETLGGAALSVTDVAQKINNAIAQSPENVVSVNLLMSDEAQVHFTEIIRQKYPEADIDAVGGSIATTLTSDEINDCIATLKRDHPDVAVVQELHTGEEARSMLVDTLLSHNSDAADDVKRLWYQEQNDKARLDAQIDKFAVQEHAIQTALQHEAERLKHESTSDKQSSAPLAHANDDYEQRLHAFYKKLTQWHRDLDDVLIDKHFNQQMAEKMHQVLHFKPAEYLNNVLNQNPFPASFADRLQQQVQQWNTMPNFAQIQAPIQPELLRNFNVEQARHIQQTLNWHYEAPKQAPREFQGTPYEQFFVNPPQGNIGNGYYQDMMIHQRNRR